MLPVTFLPAEWRCASALASTVILVMARAAGGAQQSPSQRVPTRRYAGCSLAWPVLVCRTVSIVKSRPASIRGSAGCSTQLSTCRAGDGHLSTRGLPVGCQAQFKRSGHEY